MHDGAGDAVAAGGGEVVGDEIGAHGLTLGEARSGGWLLPADASTAAGNINGT